MSTSTQIQEVLEALRSYKVDTYMLQQFEILFEAVPDILNHQVACKAKVGPDCPILPGEITRFDDMAVILTEYSRIPLIVNKQEVYSLEARKDQVMIFESPKRRIRWPVVLFYTGTLIIMLTTLLFVILTFAKISFGLWILVPIIIGFVVQMYGIFRNRPRSIGRLHNSK